MLYAVLPCEAIVDVRHGISLGPGVCGCQGLCVRRAEVLGAISTHRVQQSIVLEVAIAAVAEVIHTPFLVTT